MAETHRDGTDRLLFVSRMRKPGDEAEARAAIEKGFPVEAFERAGIVGFTAHIGGGYSVLEFGYEGPFDEIFSRLAKDEAARAYLEGLGRHVDPAPVIDPERTADLPLAADQFLWRRGTGIERRSPGPRR